MFDHFVGLALKGLIHPKVLTLRSYNFEVREVRSAEFLGLIFIKSLYLVDVRYFFQEYVFKLNVLKMGQRTCFED